MSSSNTSGQLSKLASIGSWGVRVFRAGALGPVAAGASGFMTACRFLAFTTLGRAAVVVVLLLGTFTYFKAHFTALERHKWEQTVKAKQAEIVDKVATVNAETRHAQQMARANAGYWDRLVAVVSGGIWKVEKPDPVEAETIDLINEMRIKPKK